MFRFRKRSNTIEGCSNMVSHLLFLKPPLFILFFAFLLMILTSFSTVFNPPPFRNEIVFERPLVAKDIELKNVYATSLQYT